MTLVERMFTVLAQDNETGIVAGRMALRPGENGDCYGSTLFGVYELEAVQQTDDGAMEAVAGRALFEKEVTQEHSIFMPIPYEWRLKRARNITLKIFAALAAKNSLVLEEAS